ncbi:hypothetical protein [Nocardioides pyridinolyticus]
MSGFEQASDRLDRTLSVLKRALEAVFYSVLIFVLACVILLVAAGVFGLLHQGNDFGGTPGGSGGDVIVPSVLR